MARSRVKARGLVLLARAVSSKSWFHSRTTSAASRQRSSSASTAGGGARRRRPGPRCRPRRRAGERAIRSLSQFHRVMTDLLRREGPGRGLLREDGLRYNGDIIPGAQTERRGGAGPVRTLLGGENASTAWFIQQSESLLRHIHNFLRVW